MSVEPFIIPETAAPKDGWDDPVHGKVSWRTLFSSHLTPTEGLTGGIAEVEPGGELKLHRHLPPEIYYILSGTGIVSIDGKETTVGANTGVFIPGNARHGIRNEGSETVRFFYAFARDSFDTVVYEFE